jgi:putative ABC transport system ATP-binding protein
MGKLHRFERRVFQKDERVVAIETAFSGRGLHRTMQPVSLSGVSKRYEGGVQALDGVSFDVGAGELVVLLGPSGCGKSTLLNLVGCIDLPDEGEVRIAGAATSSLSDDALTQLRRDRIGTVFQFFNLLPTLTLAENVALPLRLQGRPSAEIPARVHAALTAVGIPEKAGALPHQVSGGQVQRAAIARAIVHDPAIVLADEPTGNLDSHNGEKVLAILRELADRGQSILMATHSPEASARANRRILMRDGRIESIV